jgi:hypothetical protein
MPSTESAAIIAGLSAVGGGAIVAISNYAVGLLQAREARKAKVRDALIEFGSIVYRIDHLLRAEPKTGKTARVVNEQMAARLPLLDHAIGLTRRRLLEPNLDAFAIEMNNAITAALILAPFRLLPSMGTLADLMGRVNDRDGEWQTEWDKARTDYFLECRELLGSGVVRAPDSPDERSRLDKGPS